MIFLTLSCCLPLSILNFTRKITLGLKAKLAKNCCLKSEKKRKLGINLKKEDSGIECMQRSSILDAKNTEKEFANGVEKSLSQGMLTKNSVVQTTNLTLVCVEKRKEMKPVYNITVRDHHCFFANGVLVSNCDAFRYLGEVIREETNAKLGSIMQIPMQGTYNPFKWS